MRGRQNTGLAVSDPNRKCLTRLDCVTLDSPRVFSKPPFHHQDTEQIGAEELQVTACVPSNMCILCVCVCVFRGLIFYFSVILFLNHTSRLVLNYYPCFKVFYNFKILTQVCLTPIRKEPYLTVGAMRPGEGLCKGPQSREDNATSNHGGPHDPGRGPASLKVSLIHYRSIDWRLSGPSRKTTPLSLEGGVPWNLWVNGKSAYSGRKAGQAETGISLTRGF